MGLGGKLIRVVRGTISKYQKPASQRVHTVKAQVVTDTKVRANSGGNNGNAGGIRALSLDPEAAGLIQSYYGIDLASIPNLDENQMREFVDYLRQAEWMDDHLPKLEEHIKKYIDRQVTFNQFIVTVTKAGITGAEKIEKGKFETWLAAKGYFAENQKLGKDSDIAQQKLDRGVSDYFEFEEYNLEASFRVMAAKLAAQKAEVDARPDKANAQQEVNQQKKEHKERIKNLISYGSNPIAVMGSGGSSTDIPVSPTSPMPKGEGGFGFVGKMKDFFNGK